jgi:two-component sensor histidine kinase/CheY-like chemotaxis protein
MEMSVQPVRADQRVTRIVLLEDSDFDADLIQEHLGDLGDSVEILRAVGRSDYEQALRTHSVDVILCDYSLPGFDGLAALEMAMELAPGTPFIFVSGVLGEEIAIESFRKGATDYVLKQRLIRLAPAVKRALAEARLREEQRRARQQQDLLVHELSHRVKNTLAVVASIIRNTARHSVSKQDLEERLLGRIHAMSDAHALLFEANWTSTGLRDVLERILAPYQRKHARQIVMDGGRVDLQPNSALVLGLIIHELGTNAAKYGALSTPTGRVDVTWTAPLYRHGERRVEMTWKESGGPPVTEPTAAGFGTTLIRRSAGPELGGQAALTFPPDGVQFKLSFVVDENGHSRSL